MCFLFYWFVFLILELDPSQHTHQLCVCFVSICYESIIQGRPVIQAMKRLPIATLHHRTLELSRPARHPTPTKAGARPYRVREPQLVYTLGELERQQMRGRSDHFQSKDYMGRLRMMASRENRKEKGREVRGLAMSRNDSWEI